MIMKLYPLGKIKILVTQTKAVPSRKERENKMTKSNLRSIRLKNCISIWTFTSLWSHQASSNTCLIHPRRKLRMNLSRLLLLLKAAAIWKATSSSSNLKMLSRHRRVKWHQQLHNRIHWPILKSNPNLRRQFCLKSRFIIPYHYKKVCKIWLLNKIKRWKFWCQRKLFKPNAETFIIQTFLARIKAHWCSNWPKTNFRFRLRANWTKLINVPYRQISIKASFTLKTKNGLNKKSILIFKQIKKKLTRKKRKTMIKRKWKLVIIWSGRKRRRIGSRGNMRFSKINSIEAHLS